MPGIRLFSALLAAHAIAASATALACDAQLPVREVRIVAVADANVISLETGEEVRLASIEAPSRPLDLADAAPWPLAETSRRELEKLTLGTRFLFQPISKGPDRHGRLAGYLFARQGGALVQSALLGAGLARVHAGDDGNFCVAELLAAEAMARDRGLGIWADKQYAVRAAGDVKTLSTSEGRFEIVEGRVLNAARAGTLVYLNFGTYWKRDFTIVIDARAQKIFADAGVDPLRYQGALIRARGWIRMRDGPRIDLTFPDDIEVLAAQ